MQKMLVSCILLLATISCLGEDALSIPDKIDMARTDVTQVALILGSPKRHIPPTVRQNVRDCFDADQMHRTCIFGTALLINETGYVLTAGHVAKEGISTLKQLKSSGTEASLNIGIPQYSDLPSLSIKRSTSYLRVRVVDIDQEHDLALLKFETSPDPYNPGHIAQFRIFRSLNVPRMPIKFSMSTLRDGEDVIACGFPFQSIALVTTVGKIASSGNEETTSFARESGISSKIDIYQTALEINPGNSGGPLFRSSDLSVAGIVIERHTQSGTLSMAVPAQYIRTFLDKNGVPWEPAQTQALVTAR
jgi:S1-C subfamily serine protease